MGITEQRWHLNAQQKLVLGDMYIPYNMYLYGQIWQHKKWQNYDEKAEQQMWLWWIWHDQKSGVGIIYVHTEIPFASPSCAVIFWQKFNSFFIFIF
jgi:hypothetical protein